MKAMEKIKTKYSLEEIAVMTDRGYHTVHSWYKGTRLPHKGDWELIKKIEKNINA